MDDLAGLDWSKASNAKKPANPGYNYNASAFSALKPTPPTSGRVTPLTQSSQPPSKPATPANDSFSNLVSFSNSNSTANLSLQEQQRRLADLKLRQHKEQSQSLQNQYSGGDDFWNTFGSGRSTPAVEPQKKPEVPSKAVEKQDDDIFASFNTSTAKAQSKEEPELDDDDDPFELSKFSARRTKTQDSANGFDDDDVLGLLGNPVSSKRKAENAKVPSPPPSNATHPQDKAVAELVDMGFPVEKARRALESTDSGTDVQGAVGWLLNQAHQEARERSRGPDATRNGHSPAATERQRGNGRIQVDRSRRQDQQAEDSELPSRRQQSSGLGVEKDPAQLAAEFGNNFLKSANSFWKQSTKKMQQAVQEFNSDSESSQPKWMREPDRMAKAESRPQQRGDEAGTARRRRRSSAAKSQEQESVTDEALMLEAQRPTPPPRPVQRSRADNRFESGDDTSRDHSPAMPSRLREAHSPQPAFLRQQQSPKLIPPHTLPDPRATLNRQANEDQAAQAYVSSARRRKPPTSIPAAALEPDLLNGPSRAQAPARPASSKPSRPTPSPKPASIAVRPVAPTRTIPSISAMSLKASHSQREKGNEFFKRGDYSSAHQAYSTSITHLPASHPLTIVLLTNRALTALKTGEPKQSITDSNTAITVIGVSKGEAEQIDFFNGEPPKPMRDYYGKALMRKAEALEQMERWTDAAAVWREAVEGNHGGATSMQGRLRAEKAANPTASKPKPRAPAATRRPPAQATIFSSNNDSAAVSALSRGQRSRRPC